MVGLVAFGAGLGAMLRYGGTNLGKRVSPNWPVATIAINTLGALIVGGLTGAAVSGSWAAFLMTGICGGFTTFSTFMVDAVILLKNRRWASFVGYYLGTIGLGLLAVWCGLTIGQRYF